MAGQLVKACRFIALVALGVAVLLSADPDGNGISTVPSAIVGITAAALAWLLARRRAKRTIDRTIDDPANDP